jgi:YggT family protein
LTSNFNLGHPLCALGQIYVLILIGRAVLSWFPPSEDSPINPIRRFLYLVTEPVLAPLRRIIPPAGMLDLSFLVLFVVIEFVVIPLLCRI